MRSLVLFVLLACLGSVCQSSFVSNGNVYNTTLEFPSHDPAYVEEIGLSIVSLNDKIFVLSVAYTTVGVTNLFLTSYDSNLNQLNQLNLTDVQNSTLNSLLVGIPQSNQIYVIGSSVIQVDGSSFKVVSNLVLKQAVQVAWAASDYSVIYAIGMTPKLGTYYVTISLSPLSFSLVNAKKIDGVLFESYWNCQPSYSLSNTAFCLASTQTPQQTVWYVVKLSTSTWTILASVKNLGALTVAPAGYSGSQAVWIYGNDELTLNAYLTAYDSNLNQLYQINTTAVVPAGMFEWSNSLYVSGKLATPNGFTVQFNAGTGGLTTKTPFPEPYMPSFRFTQPAPIITQGQSTYVYALATEIIADYGLPTLVVRLPLN